jgi:hypothetical protein
VKQLASIAVIARQARMIESQKEYIKELESSIRDALSVLICVGGPLNDNAKKYSATQLVDFWKIHNALYDIQ